MDKHTYSIEYSENYGGFIILADWWRDRPQHDEDGDVLDFERFSDAAEYVERELGGWWVGT